MPNNDYIGREKKTTTQSNNNKKCKELSIICSLLKDNRFKLRNEWDSHNNGGENPLKIWLMINTCHPKNEDQWAKYIKLRRFKLKTYMRVECVCVCVVIFVFFIFRWCCWIPEAVNVTISRLTTEKSNMKRKNCNNNEKKKIKWKTE